MRGRSNKIDHHLLFYLKKKVNFECYHMKSFLNQMHLIGSESLFERDHGEASNFIWKDFVCDLLFEALADT